MKQGNTPQSNNVQKMQAALRIKLLNCSLLSSEAQVTGTNSSFSIKVSIYNEPISGHVTVVDSRSGAEFVQSTSE
jgi:hypothetical protein